MRISEAIRLADNIKFNSIEKDNMEFAVERMSCYQRDSIKVLSDFARNILADVEDER